MLKRPSAADDPVVLSFDCLPYGYLWCVYLVAKNNTKKQSSSGKRYKGSRILM